MASPGFNHAGWKNERRVQYEQVGGDELHLADSARPEDKPTELVAHRAPAGKRMPARIEPPARHKVLTTDWRKHAWVGTVGTNSE